MAESLLDDVSRARILQAVRGGNSYDVAAQLGGIAPRTFYYWMAKGRKGKEPYGQLLQDVKKARAEAVEERVARIKEASDGGTWQAAAWWLERMCYRQWGDQRKELERLRKLLAELLKGKG